MAFGIRIGLVGEQVIEHLLSPHELPHPEEFVYILASTGVLVRLDLLVHILPVGVPKDQVVNSQRKEIFCTQSPQSHGSISYFLYSLSNDSSLF